MAIAALAGCATTTEPSPPFLPAPHPVAARPQPEVFAYPRNGQSQEQQKRDRFECHEWANGQTGVDPTRASTITPAPVKAEAVPAPGFDTAVLAITGALIGATVANPRNAGAGAVAGAMVGGTLGAISDSNRQAEAQRTAEYDSYRHQEQVATHRGNDYRRALTACLEGRGYSVR